jgi:hypothetical protein
LKKKLNASEEHNCSLISDKKKLEDDLSSEKIKFARAEERIINLEKDLAQREKQWKVKEKELCDTISKLRPQPQLERSDHDTSCQSIVATSFATVVCNEGNYS